MPVLQKKLSLSATKLVASNVTGKSVFVVNAFVVAGKRILFNGNNIHGHCAKSFFYVSAPKK